MSKRKRNFKWFWSLSNLSIHHSSDKTDPKTTLKHDESQSDSTLEHKTVDDMEDACLPSPGYARSCDMYTHVGTVRRKEKQKGSNKKGSSKSELSREQSLCKTGDYVRDSPLLSALSNASLSSVDSRPLPGCIKGRTPPLKCENHSDANAAMVRPSNTARLPPVSTTLTADLYVVMDPIAEVHHSHAGEKTESQYFMGTQETRPPKDSEGVEALDSQLDPMDSSGEYVKFSKEKFWLDAPSEKLHKELEEELKLCSSNLQSHGWYHGQIPWEVSETLVVHQGDFLIRDSLSSQRDYVLTCHWNHSTLHFLISKVLVKSSEAYTRVQFTLEGEAFDSVQALVHFYVGNRTALTQQSGAQIHSPINRTLPLRYLQAAFCLASSKRGLVSSPSCQRGVLVKSRSGNVTEKIFPLSPSTVHHMEPVRSCGLSLDQIQPLSSIGESPLSPPPNTITQNRSLCGSRVPSVAPSPSVSRRSCGAQPCPSPNNNTPDTQRTIKTQASPTHSYLTTDTGNSYSELYPAPPAQSYVERLCAEEGLGVGPVNGNVYFVPVLETVSAFRPSRYQSTLMPKENKPLEMGFLRRVKELLAEVDAKTAAKHITKADCVIARILEVTPEMQRRMGVCSGMELLTLPQGHQLRLDLLERFQTMSIMLAVHVLGCTGSTEERAALLHKTIQMAAELKSNLGNMFGFAAIMRALELPQISRLEQTWMMLRQRHTEGAILYEKTLKPFMKSMNDGKESCPLSNTSFPHVVPLLSLLEKSVAVGEGVEPWETVEAGVDVVMSHLGAARTIAQLGGIYCTNAETKLQGFLEHTEVLEVFLTEFQMRLLWGSRGAEGNQAERYAKFDQVLTALSNKLEPPI